MSRYSVKMAAVGVVVTGLVLGLVGHPDLATLASHAGQDLGWGYGAVHSVAPLADTARAETAHTDMSRAHTAAMPISDRHASKQPAIERPGSGRQFTFARPVREQPNRERSSSTSQLMSSPLEFGEPEEVAMASDAIASDAMSPAALADDPTLATDAPLIEFDADAAVAEGDLDGPSLDGPTLGQVPQVVNVPEAGREDMYVVPTAAESRGGEVRAADMREPAMLKSAQPLWSENRGSDEQRPDEHTAVQLDEAAPLAIVEPVAEVEPRGKGETVSDDVDGTFAALGDMLPDDEPVDFGEQVETAGDVLRTVEPHVASRMLRRSAEATESPASKNRDGERRRDVADSQDQHNDRQRDRNSDDQFSGGQFSNGRTSRDGASGDRYRDDDLFGDRSGGTTRGADRRHDQPRERSNRRDSFDDREYDDNDRFAERHRHADVRHSRSDASSLFDTADNSDNADKFNYDDRSTGRMAQRSRERDEPSRVFDGAPGRGDTSRGDTAVEPAIAYHNSDGSNAGVVLQWETPQHVNVGQTAVCQLRVNNASSQPAHRVQLTVSLENRAQVEWSEPAHTATADHLVWDLDTLEAGEQTTIRIAIVPTSEGSLQPRAVVTATRAAMANIEIMRPELQLAVLGPSESMLGQSATYTVEIENSGSGPAMDVAIELELPRGLNHPSGERLPFRVGTLSPGATRRVQVPLTMVEGGEQRLIASAHCAGMAPTSVERTVEVAKPRLQVAMDGPKLRYVDRKATYSVTVHNPGPAPADNVRLVEDIPEGFHFVEATPGGMFDPDSRQVAWFVGRLDADTTARMGVELIPTEAGQHRVSAVVQADAGVSNEAETITRVEGTSVVAVEVIDLDDPVEATGETVYRIRVRNVGSIAAHDVQLAAQVPAEMKPLEMDGPTDGRIDGSVVLFDPIDVLPVGESRTYTVHVACRQAGDARFQAFVRTAENPKPVMEEEATRVYAD